MEGQELATTTMSSPQPGKKKKNRRGAGSRAKAAEKYREHKNETIGIPYIQDRIAKFKLANGYTTEDLFGQMSVSIPVTAPPQPVTISTHKLPEVARATVETLVSACKVPSQDVEHDVETVQLAASLQLGAKIRYAQQNTPFQTISPAEDTLAESVVRNISQSILPIAVFIDQIGKFELDGQTFVPVEDVAHDGRLYSFSYSNLRNCDLVDRTSYRYLSDQAFTIDGQPFVLRDVIDTGRVGVHGGRVYMRVHDEAAARAADIIDDQGRVNPNLVILPPPDVVEFFELRFGHALPTPEQIFARYVEFLSRVQKKVSFDKLPNLQLERGVGCESQLSYSGAWVGSYRDVYAARKVSPDSLFMGAAFELNIVEQPLTDELACAIRGTVNSHNAIPRLMQCLSQRVERKT
jgi:hypothetical protein